MHIIQATLFDFEAFIAHPDIDRAHHAKNPFRGKLPIDAIGG